MKSGTQRGHFTNARTTNFYYAFVFLPSEKRRAIEAVYAFARRGDDAVDSRSGLATGSETLARCRQDLEVCYSPWGAQAFDPQRQPELVALAEAITRFGIPRQPFDDLIRGLEMDLAIRRYETFEDLSLYCYRVASTIGLIAIEIFGYRNPMTRDYATNLGIALQLVNILRDLRSDAARDRVYLPLDDLARFGVPAEALRDGRTSDSFRELMKFESQRARYYFRKARGALSPVDRPSMQAAEIMAAIYWKLLRRIEGENYNVFERRIRLSRPMKLWTAISVYLGREWHN